jgi:hypothetical protein
LGFFSEVRPLGFAEAFAEAIAGISDKGYRRISDRGYPRVVIDWILAAKKAFDRYERIFGIF